MALSIDEVKAAVDRFAAITKDWAKDNTRNRWGTELDGLKRIFNPNEQSVSNIYPEYWEGYNYAVNQNQSIEPHTRRNLFPERLFGVRTPHQTPQEKQWIKENFKSVTLPIWNDSISTISRATSRSNYRIRISSESDEIKNGFEEYLNKGIPNHHSFSNWLQAYFTPIKQKDANGVIATMPLTIKTTQLEDGTTIVSDELIKPAPVYFNSKDIVGKEDNVYFLLNSNEKSFVEVGGKTVKAGNVLYLFDDTYIWKIEQVGKMIDYRFSEPQIYLEHYCGEIPVAIIGGSPNQIGNSIVFDSAFSYVVDILDLVLMDEMNIGIAKTKCIYPYRIMLGSKCDFVDGKGNQCLGGKITGEHEKPSTCPNCHGLGMVSRVSPMGELLINPTDDDQMNPGDKLTGVGDPIKYISPSTDTVKFLREEIAANEMRARKQIHIVDSDSAVSGNEGTTATGSLNKLRATKAFISPIADSTFDTANKQVRWMACQRYGNDMVNVSISHSNNYDINTPADYLSAIGEAKKSGAPPMVLTALINQYVDSIVGADVEAKRAFDLLINTDQLITNSQDEISLRIAGGTADKWMDVAHNAGFVLINSLLKENPDFFDQDFTKQQEDFIAEAKKQLPTMVDPQTQAKALILGA